MLTASSVVVDGVRKVFGSLTAVDQVSWTAEPGRVVCLLGDSGCGKSTLLRMIAGIEPVDGGRILLDGEVMSAPGRTVPPERRAVGLVFQDHALFPHLSAVDNVRFGLTGADGRARALTALDRVGLTGRAAAFPHTLSGGEQQRVALARALAPGPRLILMDEPFSNLDRRLRDRVRDETLALLREAGATALIVTHDPDEALRIADQVVLLRAGRVVQDASPRAMFEAPTSLFAARFFSELTELVGTSRSGRVETPLGSFPAPFPDGTPARVCLRTHALVAEPAGAMLANRFRGTVVDVAFLGHQLELRLAVPGISAPVHARCPAGVAARPGDPFHLEVLRDQALVFRDEPVP